MRAMASIVSVYAASYRPYNMTNTSYPKGYWLDLSTSSAYLRWRPTADVNTSFNVLGCTSSSTRLNSPVDANIGYTLNTSVTNYPFAWTLALPHDGIAAYYMTVQQDTARPTRIKLTVAGNISADNLPALLVERLAELEAHVQALEVQLGVAPASRIAQYPPHVLEDPVPDPYVPEVDP